MAGPLGVTHLLLFSRSPAGYTSLRIAKFPRGPTLHFRVAKYSLCKDIQKVQRRPKNDKHEYRTAPLVSEFYTPCQILWRSLLETEASDE